MTKKTVMSESEYKNTAWKMSYEEYVKCYCPDCNRDGCIHRDTYRRVPRIDRGLGLCPNLQEV